jgi:hypothetical protein
MELFFYACVNLFIFKLEYFFIEDGTFFMKLEQTICMRGTLFNDGTVFLMEARIYQFYVRNKLVVQVEQINRTYGIN